MMQIIMAGGGNQGSVMGGGTATGERYSLVLEGKAIGNMTTFESDSTGYRERVEKFANVMGQARRGYEKEKAVGRVIKEAAREPGDDIDKMRLIQEIVGDPESQRR